MTESLTAGVRVLPSEIGTVIPVVDIIGNIGYSRSSVTKALNRHPDMFKGLTTFQPIDTRRGSQQGQCLNGAGVRNLILLLQPSAESKPELRARVEAFKAEQYGKLEEPGRAPGPDPLTAALQKQADIADILITKWGRDPEAVRRLCMSAVIEECGDAIRYRGLFACEDKTPLLPPPETIRKDFPECEKCNGSLGSFDPDYEKYFSARKIAKFTGQTEDQVRNILEKEGLTSWAHGITSLTILGRQFGKVFITYPEWPHRTYEQKNIRWSNAAVERVKAHISTGQSKLATAPG